MGIRWILKARVLCVVLGYGLLQRASWSASRLEGEEEEKRKSRASSGGGQKDECLQASLAAAGSNQIHPIVRRLARPTDSQPLALRSPATGGGDGCWPCVMKKKRRLCLHPLSRVHTDGHRLVLLSQSSSSIDATQRPFARTQERVAQAAKQRGESRRVWWGEQERASLSSSQSGACLLS